MGVGADMIKEKEREILNVFNPQNIAASGQVYGSNIVGQSKPHDAATGGQLDIADKSQVQSVSGFP